MNSENQDSNPEKNSPDQQSPTICAYDSFGREVQVPREEWLRNVLLPQVQKVWENADDLYDTIYNGFNDGFFAEMEEAGKQLKRIDPIMERGSVTLAVIYLQTGRPQEAKNLLELSMAEHGERGILLTNLAKAESALGNEDEAERILWHALELDPNQDNGLMWYVSIQHQKGGDDFSQSALRSVSALPGSWRAQVWLAREHLKDSDIDAAMELYREALHRMPSPVPTEILMQISGDLGNRGFLPEILELTESRFDLDVHGLQVGNNLLKVYLETGQLDKMHHLLKQMNMKQRPDWREHLEFWEAELHKLELSINDEVKKEELKVGLIQGEGPVWLPKKGALKSLFAPKAENAVCIGFVGSSFSGTHPNESESVQMQLSDNFGRLSRSIPAFLTEHFYLNSNAMTTLIIPWVTNENGGFAVSGNSLTNKSVLSYCGNDTDYVVYTHLLFQGENSTLQVRVLRNIDGKCIFESSYDFPEFSASRILDALLKDLRQNLLKEAGLSLSGEYLLESVEGSELDHYLFRLEQCLAVRCSSTQGNGGLYNVSEIIDGSMHFCLNHLRLQSAWLLLLRVLKSIGQKEPDLIQSFSEKIALLLKKLPEQLPHAEDIQAEFKSVLKASNT